MMSGMPLVDLLSGVVLLCAFLQIASRRLQGMVVLARIASWAMAGVAVAQGVMGHDPAFYGIALLIVAVQAFALPRLILCKSEPLHPSGPLRRAVSMPLSLIIGLLPIGLVVLDLSPVSGNGRNLGGGSAEVGLLVMAMSAIMLGIWLTVIYGPRLARMVGFMTLENGLILALLTMQGIGWVALIGIIALQCVGAGLIWMGGLRPEVPTQAETSGATL